MYQIASMGPPFTIMRFIGKLNLLCFTCSNVPMLSLFTDYRMMVLAKLPWINFLDDRGVDPKEALDALEFQSHHNSKWNSALAELGPVEKKIGQFVKTAKDRTIASGTHQLERTKGALNIFFKNWKSSRLNRPKSRFA